MHVNSTHNENLNHLLPYPQSKNKKLYKCDRFIPNREAIEKSFSNELYRMEVDFKETIQLEEERSRIVNLSRARYAIGCNRPPQSEKKSPEIFKNLIRPQNAYEANLYHVLFNGRHPDQLTLSTRTITHTSLLPKWQYEFASVLDGSASVRVKQPFSWTDTNLITLAMRDSLYMKNTANLDNEETIHYELDQNEIIDAFEWNSKNSQLAIAYNRDSLMIWDANSQKGFDCRSGIGRQKILQMNWIDSNIMGVGYNRAFELFDKRDPCVKMKMYDNLDDDTIYTGFQLAQNGYQIYFTTLKGEIQIVDLRGEQKVLSTQKVANGMITYFQRLGDNTQKMMTGSNDGCIKIFDIKDEKFKCEKKVNTARPIVGMAKTQQGVCINHENGYLSFLDASFKTVEVYKVFGLRSIVSDPSKKRLSILIDKMDQTDLNFFKFS